LQAASGGRIHAFIRKKEQTKKEEARQKNWKITPVIYEFV
jgi:hypothetical protein